MERPLSLTRRPEQRQSFATINILRKITYFSTVMAGLVQAGGSKAPQPPALKAELYSFADALTTIQQELGDKCEVSYMKKGGENIPKEDPPEEPEPAKSVAETCEWLVKYQQPVDETDCEDADCNDDARVTCKRLTERGLHMSYLNLFGKNHPLDPQHQVAVCKVEGKYIIIDNAKFVIVLENLSPQEYYEHYHGHRMQVGSFSGSFGVTKFTEPKYEFGPFRLLNTALNTVEHIEETPLTRQLFAQANPK